MGKTKTISEDTKLALRAFEEQGILAYPLSPEHMKRTRMLAAAKELGSRAYTIDATKSEEATAALEKRNIDCDFLWVLHNFNCEFYAYLGQEKQPVIRAVVEPNLEYGFESPGLLPKLHIAFNNAAENLSPLDQMKRIASEAYLAYRPYAERQQGGLVNHLSAEKPSYLNLTFSAFTSAVVGSIATLGHTLTLAGHKTFVATHEFDTMRKNLYNADAVSELLVPERKLEAHAEAVPGPYKAGVLSGKPSLQSRITQAREFSDRIGQDVSLGDMHMLAGRRLMELG